MNFWAIITRITTENKLISFMNNKPIIISPIPISKKVIDNILRGKFTPLSTREGGLIQGTANDDVIMAPGIARGRNAGLSQADVAAIAKAVRDGASQAQINLDGGRVSNRLQPSLAVNTRKYSI